MFYFHLGLLSVDQLLSVKLQSDSLAVVYVSDSDVLRVLLSHQRPTQQILWVLYSLWATPSSSPAAVTGTFTSPTLGRLLLLSFHLRLRLRVNPSSGGQTPPQVRPAAGSSESPRPDRRRFQTSGTREEPWVGLSWTSKHVAATWTMSECRGLRRWTTVSQCQVSSQRREIHIRAFELVLKKTKHRGKMNWTCWYSALFTLTSSADKNVSSSVTLRTNLSQ